jgi:hypothetical protein
VDEGTIFLVGLVVNWGAIVFWAIVIIVVLAILGWLFRDEEITKRTE